MFFTIWELGGPRQVENLRVGFISNFKGRHTFFEMLLFPILVKWATTTAATADELSQPIQAPSPRRAGIKYL